MTRKTKARKKKVCPVCGREFELTSSAQLICSPECRIIRKREYKRKKAHQEKACVVCGKMFTPKSSRQIICGDPECRRRRATILASSQRQTRVNRASRSDGIIAIGYAERQIANTMAKVPPIRVEL